MLVGGGSSGPEDGAVTRGGGGDTPVVRRRGGRWAGLRPYVVNLTDGQFSQTGRMHRCPHDVDAIFDVHLPAFIDETARLYGDDPVPLVIWAHGGVVSETRGLTIAEHRCPGGWRTASTRCTSSGRPAFWRRRGRSSADGRGTTDSDPTLRAALLVRSVRRDGHSARPGAVDPYPRRQAACRSGPRGTRMQRTAGRSAMGGT